MNEDVKVRFHIITPFFGRDKFIYFRFMMLLCFILKLLNEEWRRLTCALKAFFVEREKKGGKKFVLVMIEILIVIKRIFSSPFKDNFHKMCSTTPLNHQQQFVRHDLAFIYKTLLWFLYKVLFFACVGKREWKMKKVIFSHNF